ncbi:MAG: hypothetical protein RBS73_08275 [Prolixibacteraceae bacterium]|jgi:hypothetical protein|nr:hypothetical protein [Prolixibacteraceae bacterium]
MEQLRKVDGTLQTSRKKNPVYYFLIGGHDLEMLTIIDLLKKHLPKNKVFDRGLKWGACLSSYQDLFNSQDVFIGIELKQDIAPPKNYIEIDHHYENSGEPSSIDQIICFLKKAYNIEVEVTRYIQLISANDSGYIPAMLAIGATEEEIADIRRRDREAQGATEEDEWLAEKSIKENLTIEGGITIVKSLTSRFSIITDRLYPYNRLMVYNDNELNYYGKGINQLIRIFEQLISNGDAYHGGGKNGFFGIANGALSSNQIMEIVKQIINIQFNKQE